LFLSLYLSFLSIVKSEYEKKTNEPCRLKKRKISQNSLTSKIIPVQTLKLFVLSLSNSKIEKKLLKIY